jgi:cysteinyl-tRNA synthetase
MNPMKKPLPPIRLYNTLTRRVDLFKPIKKGAVGLYTCGPTVYNYAHVGNLRTFVFEDLLERMFVWNGYRVKRVMNVTDVGHLTGDTDEGQDKVEKEAAAEKKTPLQIVRFYTAAFLRDMKRMNNHVPKILAPATGYIRDQIALIKKLFKKGYAYETPKAVYFDVSRFKNYGKLSGQSLAEKATGARTEVVTDPAKRNAADFALWFKLVDRFEHHLMRWPSPWGAGFPGWHIECSAISRKFLGQPFDIHAGGIDHIGTHHANEIAQSEGAFGKPLAHYWLHGEFLLVDKDKMAKSQGNFYTLEDAVEQHIPPLAYRYLILTAHYRTPLNFSWLALESAKNAFHGLIGRVLYVRFRAEYQTKVPPSPEIEAARTKFREAISNDLNIPQALALTHTLLADTRLVNTQAKNLLALVLEFDDVFGLRLKDYLKKCSMQNLLKDRRLKALLTERQSLRDHQQFMQSDRLRKQVNALGYVLEDTPHGSFVAPAHPEL